MAFTLFLKEEVTSKYRKTGNPTLTVIIPADRKQIPAGTFQSILPQAGLSKEDF